ncbi:VCBS repeat-containing protein, partial [Arthrospira platensis SPKY1]|nr:VCBS repeat-containing protein [Arthrospira platensis SPKY1]
MFTAEQDRLFWNLGDGQFRDVTESCGIKVPDGKGLGVVAADFEGNGRVHLFVSNDTTANFYFVNQTPQGGGSPSFREDAILSGLAFDENGVAQSCMGIAVG